MKESQDIDLLTILGLGLTLREYEEHVLGGDTPHYEQADLVFECTHCGKCCTRPGVVYLTHGDLDAMAGFGKTSAEEIKQTWLTEGDEADWMIEVLEGEVCPFLVEDMCVIHEVKPLQCQTYPFWPEVVGTASAWRHERDFCPGIGQGKAFGTDEVRRLLLGLERTP